MAIDLPAGLQAYLPASLIVNGELAVSKEQATEIASGIQARVQEMPPAQAAVFLAMVNSADFAPAGGRSPADLEATLSRFEAISAEIGNVVSSSNTLDFLARAMMEQAAQQRKNKLEEGLLAREIAKGEMLAQAGKLKEASEEMKSNALVSVIVGSIMAGLSVMASLASVGTAAKSASSALGSAKEGLASVRNAREALVATKAAQKLADAGDDAGAAAQTAIAQAKNVLSQAHSTASQGLGSVFQTSGYNLATQGLQSGAGFAGQIGQTVSNYFSTLGQAEAKHSESEGAMAAALAEEQKGVADVKKEAQQALDEMVKSIIAFLKEIADAKANQMQVLTRV